MRERKLTLEDCFDFAAVFLGAMASGMLLGWPLMFMMRDSGYVPLTCAMSLFVWIGVYAWGKRTGRIR